MNRSLSLALSAIVCCAIGAMLSSCGTKKTLVDEPKLPTSQPSSARPADPTVAVSQFVKKVNDNAVYAKSVSSKIDVTISRGGKDISVGGKLQMRRDEVIRIQLNIPLLGMEAGRLEFTKDHVLIVDRIHSEYVKGSYGEIDFLKDNGLNFYALQALFWNQLFVPGQTKVTDAMLSQFVAELDGGGKTTPVTLTRDKMKYTWLTDSKTGRIQRVGVDYNSTAHGTTHVSCDYDDFKALGVKSFPCSIVLDMQTTAKLSTGSASAKSLPKNLKLAVKMKGIDTDGNWDTFTTVSKKYKQVSADDVLKKLMNM